MRRIYKYEYINFPIYKKLSKGILKKQKKQKSTKQNKFNKTKETYQNRVVFLGSVRSGTGIPLLSSSSTSFCFSATRLKFAGRSLLPPL